MRWTRVSLGAAAGVAAVAVHDVLQRRHAILRNFPVVGHARYAIEKIGPELRQYVVAGNDEERPFSRDQRRWVYASAKGENNYFGFGTDNDIEHPAGYVIIKQQTFGRTAPPTSAVTDPATTHPPRTPCEAGAPQPYQSLGEDARLPCAKVLGATRGRRRAFRPDSVVNISGMSFGSLSGNAVTALNRGAALAGCLQDTGEGSISPYHRGGGDLVYQLGTGYFGCRDERGRFDLARLKDAVASAPVRALEIKLSQGAKPGLGGVLPAAKVSREIATTRGVPEGVDCISPSRHAEFSDADSMLDWVEMLADETGLPVGIKSAVGDLGFWHDLVRLTADTGRAVDFVTIDGGEGGTGAAPMVFADSVSLPFRLGFSRVYRIFAEAGLHESTMFVGSGKLGLPENAVVAFALGADMVNVGREAMLAIGCVQAQKCHTDRCPTGVTTQNPWLARGLDPDLKSVRCANYVRTLRRDLLKLAEATGVEHPGLIGSSAVEILTADATGRPLHEVYGYDPAWGFPSAADRAEIVRLMAGAPEGGAAPEGDATPPVAASTAATG